jgi:protein-S-isoprenylcysteine O-methyltransferase Ste14
MAQKKRNPWVSLLEGIIVLGAPVLFHLLIPLRTVVAGPWRFLGIIPMLLALMLANKGAAEFRKAKTGFELQGGGSSLVTSGPFRFSRNPIYLGVLVWLLGLAILLGSLISFLFPVLFFIFANLLLIPLEERTMAQTFDAQFDEYRKRVRRWI